MSLFGRKKGKEKFAVNMWEFYDSTKEMAHHASSWDARVFYVLLNSEDSHDLLLEDVDTVAGVVYLSIGGPRFTGEPKESRIEYAWKKSDETLKHAEKGQVMQMLTDRYRQEVPERRDRVNKAGQIIGWKVFI